MQSVTYTIARPDTGAVLPYAVVTVYRQDGTTRASLFDAEGAAIGNPISADTNGAISFAALNGTYILRAVSADGELTLPDLTVQVFDLAALATAIAAVSLGGVIGAKYATKAARDADLTKDDGTIALVYGDSEPLNNDLSYKIGAAGSGSWSAPLGLMAGLSASYAALSQAWAEGAEPGGPGTKSAEGWAAEAAASAASASSLVAFAIPWVLKVPDPDTTGAYLIPAFEFWPAEQRVWRDGAVRAYSDVTAHVDGGFTLGTVPAGLSAGSTVIYEFEHTFGTAVAGTFYSQSGATATSISNGFNVAPLLASAGGGLGFCGARITNFAAANAVQDLFQYGRSRFAVAVPASGTALYGMDDQPLITGPASATYAAPARICIGRRVDAAQIISGVTIKRVLIFAGVLNASEIQAVFAALEPFPEVPAVVPKWVPEILADDGTTLRPLMHPDWDEGRCWFENQVYPLTDILELRGTAPNQQWVAKRIPRGLRAALGWTVTTDVAFPAAWQSLALNPSGQLFQSFNPTLNAPTVSASRLQWVVAVSGGLPFVNYVCSYAANTTGNLPITPPLPTNITSIGADYINGINRMGVTVPPASGTVLSGFNARPIGTTIGASSLNAETLRPAYFGWGGFYNGSAYSLPLTNGTLVAATVWPRALSASEFKRAMRWNEHGSPGVWMHGDSGGNLGLWRDSTVLHARAAGYKYLPTFRTARGGAGLRYHDLYQAAWIAMYPELAEMNFALNEMGLDVGNQFDLSLAALNPIGVRDAIDILNRMAARHPGKLMYICEPQTNLAAVSGLIRETGTARAGTASSVTLASGATSTNISTQAVRITGGAGAGQTRFITGYNTTTKVADVSPNWTVTPDGTSTYQILSNIEYLREFIEAFRSTFPESFVAVTRLLQSQYATSDEYEAAVSAGTTPASLRSDDIHLNFGTWSPSDSGHYWLGLATFRKWQDVGLRQ